MKASIFFIVFIVLFLYACKTIGPAAFWNGFDSDHIVKNVSDQGPWGGNRLIYWKNNERPYNAKDVVIFAALHRWHHFRTDSLSPEESTNWITIYADSLSLHRPHNYDFIEGRGVLLTFADSSWMSVESDSAKVALGYALLSIDGKQLAIYHKWGE